MTRRELSRFSVAVPTQWTPTVYGENELHRGLYGFRGEGAAFLGPQGEYLDVIVDLETETPGSDVFWKSKVSAAGALEVDADETLCRPPEPRPSASPEASELVMPPPCLAGDGRLDALTIVSSPAHTYVIGFGNEKRERAEDLRIFKDILRTFRPK